MADTLTHEFTGTMLGKRKGEYCRITKPGQMRSEIAFGDGKRFIVPRMCLRRLKTIQGFFRASGEERGRGLGIVGARSLPPQRRPRRRATQSKAAQRRRRRK